MSESESNGGMVGATTVSNVGTGTVQVQQKTPEQIRAEEEAILVANESKRSEILTKMQSLTQEMYGAGVKPTRMVEIANQLKTLVVERERLNPQTASDLSEYQVLKKEHEERGKRLQSLEGNLVALGQIATPQTTSSGTGKGRGRPAQATEMVTEEQKLANMLRHTRSTRAVTVAKYIRDNSPVTADKLMADFGVNTDNGTMKQILRGLGYYKIISFDGSALGVMSQLPDGTRVQQIFNYIGNTETVAKYNAFLAEHGVMRDAQL